MYSEINGDLIQLAKDGHFDVIAHGCNCFCTMSAGIAPKMAEAFGCDKLPLEDKKYRGDINKLGQIDYKEVDNTTIINVYSQYSYGKNHKDGVFAPIDYEALELCLRKINHIFAGKIIGLPMIGCGLAGGNWLRVKSLILEEFKDCDVIIVKFKK